MGKGESQISQDSSLLLLWGAPLHVLMETRLHFPSSEPQCPKWDLTGLLGQSFHWDGWLSCRADGEGEEGFSLKCHRWQACRYTAGPLESVMVRSQCMWALYNLLPYGPQALDVTEIFVDLVVVQVTVVHSATTLSEILDTFCSSLLALMVCSIFSEETLCIHAQ